MLDLSKLLLITCAPEVQFSKTTLLAFDASNVLLIFTFVVV